MSSNNSNNNSSTSGGIGFLGLLTIVFIVLKLTHFINWSWWWVLAPLWIPTSIGIIIIVIMVIAKIIVHKKRMKRAKERLEWLMRGENK